jgi:hypothetical protein
MKIGKEMILFILKENEFFFFLTNQYINQKPNKTAKTSREGGKGRWIFSTTNGDRARGRD